eukprot:GHVS01080071.1.p1 GENE.GHVS01080071.1~~GHVS01080071.1.p1  ORF type:complete len:1038 (+),score=228.37 GHVS01080071.1:146-3259(+)
MQANSQQHQSVVPGRGGGWHKSNSSPHRQSSRRSTDARQQKHAAVGDDGDALLLLEGQLRGVVLQRSRSCNKPDKDVEGRRNKSVVNSRRQLTEARSGRRDTDSCLNAISLEYAFDDLSESTDSFSAAVRLGQGAYGSVYKGLLKDGTEIAIKVLNAPKEAGFEEEVKVLSKFRHPNLVILMGFARHGKSRMLVYEMLAGGDVGTRLLKGPPLLWRDRLSIALDAACGLSHLHNSLPKVFHRDIKTANILIDRNGSAKMSDFGLACLTTDCNFTVKQAAGTVGYADPQYITSSVVNEKTEVYSFGMVLMELLTGRPPAVQSHDGSIIYLVSYMGSTTGGLLRLLDVSAGFPPYFQQQLADLIFRCISEADSDRPDTRTIVQQLRKLNNATQLWHDENSSAVSPSADSSPSSPHPACDRHRPSHSLSSSNHGQRRTIAAQCSTQTKRERVGDKETGGGRRQQTVKASNALSVGGGGVCTPQMATTTAAATGLYLSPDTTSASSSTPSHMSITIPAHPSSSPAFTASLSARSDNTAPSSSSSRCCYSSPSRQAICSHHYERPSHPSPPTHAHKYQIHPPHSPSPSLPPQTKIPSYPAALYYVSPLTAALPAPSIRSRSVQKRTITSTGTGKAAGMATAVGGSTGGSSACRPTHKNNHNPSQSPRRQPSPSTSAQQYACHRHNQQQPQQQRHQVMQQQQLHYMQQKHQPTNRHSQQMYRHQLHLPQQQRPQPQYTHPMPQQQQLFPSLSPVPVSPSMAGAAPFSAYRPQQQPPSLPSPCISPRQLPQLAYENTHLNSHEQGTGASIVPAFFDGAELLDAFPADALRATGVSGSSSSSSSSRRGVGCSRSSTVSDWTSTSTNTATTSHRQQPPSASPPTTLNCVYTRDPFAPSTPNSPSSQVSPSPSPSASPASASCSNPTVDRCLRRSCGGRTAAVQGAPLVTGGAAVAEEAGTRERGRRKPPAVTDVGTTGGGGEQQETLEPHDVEQAYTEELERALHASRTEFDRKKRDDEEFAKDMVYALRQSAREPAMREESDNIP